MINIRKNTNNRFGLSLSELSIAGEPEIYRMEFTSENSKDVKVITELTPYESTSRLQYFTLQEGGYGVEFPLTGYYSYEVYQTTSNNLVEVGMLRVVAQDEELQEYQPSGTDQVYGS